MPKTIGVLALSVNLDTFRTHYFATCENFLQANVLANDDDIFVEGLVYTQGYDWPLSRTGLRIIRDDTMYNKGYSISEIRDYFTKKAFDEYGYDYILFADDDFKFGPRSGECILRDFDLMEDHRDVGITNFHYNIKLDCESYFGEYYDFNPSRVCTRSGIFVRRDAYVTWGGKDKVIYYEECVLACEAYMRGYRVVHSIADIIHITKRTGLGKTMEREYEDNFDEMVGGRQVMCRRGYFVPATNHKGFPDYRKPCKISPIAQHRHDVNHERIVKGLSPEL